MAGFGQGIWNIKDHIYRRLVQTNTDRFGPSAFVPDLGPMGSKRLAFSVSSQCKWMKSSFQDFARGNLIIRSPQTRHHPFGNTSPTRISMPFCITDDNLRMVSFETLYPRNKQRRLLCLHSSELSNRGAMFRIVEENRINPCNQCSSKHIRNHSCPN